MKRKDYEKPTMQVVKVQLQAHLLAASVYQGKAGMQDYDWREENEGTGTQDYNWNDEPEE